MLFDFVFLWSTFKWSRMRTIRARLSHFASRFEWKHVPAVCRPMLKRTSSEAKASESEGEKNENRKENIEAVHGGGVGTRERKGWTASRSDNIRNQNISLGFIPLRLVSVYCPCASDSALPLHFDPPGQQQQRPHQPKSNGIFVFLLFTWKHAFIHHTFTDIDQCVRVFLSHS